MDTYGTFLAAAELVVGAEALEDIGLELSDQPRLAEVLQAALAVDFSEQIEKWRECLEHLLASPIDAHRGGDKLTVGGVLVEFENPQGGLFDLKGAQDRLALVGLGLKKADGPGQGPYLAVPVSKHPALNRMFQDTDFLEGGWKTALKQAPNGIVQDAINWKIQRVATPCLMVDLAAYDRLVEGDG